MQFRMERVFRKVKHAGRRDSPTQNGHVSLGWPSPSTHRASAMHVSQLGDTLGRREKQIIAGTAAPRMTCAIPRVEFAEPHPHGARL
jgi:hypothetical protein